MTTYSLSSTCFASRTSVDMSMSPVSRPLQATRGSNASRMARVLQATPPREFDLVAAARRAGLGSPVIGGRSSPVLKRRTTSWRAFRRTNQTHEGRRGPTRPGVVGPAPPPPAVAPPAELLAAHEAEQQVQVAAAMVMSPSVTRADEDELEWPPIAIGSSTDQAAAPARRGRLVDLMPQSARSGYAAGRRRRVRARAASPVKSPYLSTTTIGADKRRARRDRVPSPVIYASGPVQTASRRITGSPSSPAHSVDGFTASTSLSLSASLSLRPSRFVDSPTASVARSRRSSAASGRQRQQHTSSNASTTPSGAGNAKYTAYLRKQVQGSRKRYQRAEKVATK